MKKTTERIGFIGLGNMGYPMVALLAKAGYEISIFDLNHQVVSAMVKELGVTASSSLDELGQFSDIVITMLPNSCIVKQVTLGTLDCPGFVKNLKSGSLIIDMGSSFPIDTKELAEQLKSKNIGLIDAPVSGGVKGAIKGTLTIMMGGDTELTERAQPVLEVLGKTYHTGLVGSGHTLKALNNYVSAAGLTAACEALLIGQQFGLDSKVIIDVLNASSGRNNSTETKLLPFVISGTFAAGFSAELMAKDIRSAHKLAQALEIQTPLLDANTAIWNNAAQTLVEQKDHTAMYLYLKSLSDAGSLKSSDP